MAGCACRRRQPACATIDNSVTDSTHANERPGANQVCTGGASRTEAVELHNRALRGLLVAQPGRYRAVLYAFCVWLSQRVRFATDLDHRIHGHLEAWARRIGVDFY